MEQTYVVYLHVKKGTNDVFYVGLGKSSKRAYRKANRNQHWHNIVNKYGYDVKIVKENLTKKEAEDYETEFIALFGRNDLSPNGILCNQTDGGEGGNNCKWTDEAKKKKSESMMGENNPMYGKKRKDYVCEALNKSRTYTSVSIDGKEYPSEREAARQLDMIQSKLRYRLDSSGFPEWKRLTKRIGK